MSEFKVDETKFDEWWEENYMNVSADRSEAFDIYTLGIKHQQSKVEELKASHYGEVIGHEVYLKKIKQERNELQTLYIQQGINMLKLQKRVDKAIRFLVEAELYQSEPNIDLAVKALKGENND